MEKHPVQYLSGILAGFALIRLPLAGFLAPLAPLLQVTGMVAVIIFSLVLIIQGLYTLAGKRKRF